MDNQTGITLCTVYIVNDYYLFCALTDIYYIWIMSDVRDGTDEQ